MASTKTRRAGGILLLYHHPLRTNAPTLLEHVAAFARHSRHRVVNVNTEYGCPRFLKDGSLDFDVVVCHYTLFGIPPYRLDDYFTAFLDWTSAYKVAFFQDEYHYSKARYAFLDAHAIDCVWTLLAPEHWPKVYGANTRVPRLVHTLPGFASEKLTERPDVFAKPDGDRSIDIGYRGRTLPLYMGAGAQEKSEIARGVLDRAAGAGLMFDVAVDESNRIYGDAWFHFLGDCRGTLGTESGVSIFDVDDEIRPMHDALVAAGAPRGEILAALAPHEGQIPLRVVSPRHFEAAALRTCQIMFEGRYSGIFEPHRHYIPLAKDFSNWDEALERFRDPASRRELTERAYSDVIASGRYTYGRFLEQFDAELADAGANPAPANPAADTQISRDLRRTVRSHWRRRMIELDFPGRTALLRPTGLGSLRRTAARRRYERWARSRAAG